MISIYVFYCVPHLSRPVLVLEVDISHKTVRQTSKKGSRAFKKTSVKLERTPPEAYMTYILVSASHHIPVTAPLLKQPRGLHAVPSASTAHLSLAGIAYQNPIEDT